jgi:hypothetical protein
MLSLEFRSNARPDSVQDRTELKAHPRCLVAYRPGPSRPDVEIASTKPRVYLDFARLELHLAHPPQVLQQTLPERLQHGTNRGTLGALRCFAAVLGLRTGSSAQFYWSAMRLNADFSTGAGRGTSVVASKFSGESRTIQNFQKQRENWLRC